MLSFDLLLPVIIIYAGWEINLGLGGIDLKTSWIYPVFPVSISFNLPFPQFSRPFPGTIADFVGAGSDTKQNKKLKFWNIEKQTGIVTHHFSPSTREAEASRSLQVQGQPGLHREFKDSQGYEEKLCLKKQTNKKELDI